jgi:hypothetical protein
MIVNDDEGQTAFIDECIECESLVRILLSRFSNRVQIAAFCMRISEINSKSDNPKAAIVQTMNVLQKMFDEYPNEWDKKNDKNN